MKTHWLPLVLLVYVASYRAEVKAQEDSDHWSFRPIQTVRLPDVMGSDWVESPLDRFILARLEAEQLAPADRAPPTKLIRRIYLDLTGLPPGPAEIDEFVSDQSPDAWSRLVDRVLTSPQYGERWARHWLDVARYADSNGLDENRAYVNAFNYRDYVIRSFNRDAPFDQFLKEQIAGDLLPINARDPVVRLAIKTDRMIATGFLAIGPKGLREVDGTKMEMDIIDDQVATVSKAFMALTFECARCHDHKFDPILTDDYYALAGVFKSTRTMTQIIDGRGKGNGFWVEQAFPRNPAAQIRFDKKLAAHEQSLNAARSELPPGIAKIVDLDEKNRSSDQQSELATWKSTRENADRLAHYLQLRNQPPMPPPTGMAMSVSEGTVQNVQVHVRGSHLNMGDEVARGVPSFLTGGSESVAEQSSGRMQLARWLASPEHPLTSRVIVNRIWRWHFGHGLVRSPDNFGIIGEEPSHPELLDWLAADFMQSGWSIKRLHRMIVLSSTYQQACRAAAGLRADPANADPENRLLWHFPRLRMDAEQVRDSILFVGGQLDQSLGGSLLTLEPRDYVTDAKSFKHLVTYDNGRRSVYQPVIRNKVYGLFRVFDFPTPSLVNGDRSSTNIPAQALLLMNSPLVTRSAAGLAESLLGDSRLNDEQRIARGYQTVLGRRPNCDEVQSALTYVRSFAMDSGEPELGWQSVLHALMVSNEFLYIE